MSGLFVRISSNPRADLRRGVSYPMGMYGQEEEAHAGLSGYGVTERGDLVEALRELDDRMGIHGEYRRRGGGIVSMRLAVFRGRTVGRGPDGEELFAPQGLLATFGTAVRPAIFGQHPFWSMVGRVGRRLVALGVDPEEILPDGSGRATAEELWGLA